MAQSPGSGSDSKGLGPLGAKKEAPMMPPSTKPAHPRGRCGEFSPWWTAPASSPRYRKLSRSPAQTRHFHRTTVTSIRHKPEPMPAPVPPQILPTTAPNFAHWQPTYRRPLYRPQRLRRPKTEVRQGWQGWRGKRGAWRASKPPHASSRCATENAAIAEILDANGTSASRRTSATKKTAGIGSATSPYPASGVA